MNNITSRLPNASTKVFVVQACFGLGGTIAPFIATAFAQQLPTRAYLYFLVAMGVALLTMFVMIITIQGRTEQQIVGRLDTEETPMAALKASNDVQQRSTYMNGVVNGNEPDSEAMDGANSRNEKISETLPIPPLVPTDVAPPGAERSSWDKMRLMFRRRATWALLIYSFVYVSHVWDTLAALADSVFQVGAEITLSGYIVRATRLCLNEQWLNVANLFPLCRPLFWLMLEGEMRLRAMQRLATGEVRHLQHPSS